MYNNAAAIGTATSGVKSSNIKKYDPYLSSSQSSSDSDSDGNLPVRSLQSSLKLKRRREKKKMAKLVTTPTPSAKVHNDVPPSSKKRKKNHLLVTLPSPSPSSMARSSFASFPNSASPAGASTSTMDYSTQLVDENDSKISGGDSPYLSTSAAAASAPTKITLSTVAATTKEDKGIADIDPPTKCHYCRVSTVTYRRCHFYHKNGKMCNRPFCQMCLETKFSKISTLDSVSGNYMEDVDYCLPISERDTGWHCPVCLAICDCKLCVVNRKKKKAKAEAAALIKVAVSPKVSASAASSVTSGDGGSATRLSISSSPPSSQKMPAKTITTTTDTPSTSSAAKKKKRRKSTQSRKCHDCKKPSSDHRRCHFWFMNGTKCGKVYCQKCLAGKYGLKEKFEDLLSDADWHCPACLGTCTCKACVRLRERTERRTSSNAMDRRSSTRTSAGFYSF
mmetsp:Transcript_37790/g.55278  ORF Transcript_37790/g.55278 Transcript_37790/m.55278 type:complete len:449 (-) Transcript_37790:182-1528(-)